MTTTVLGLKSLFPLQWLASSVLDLSFQVHVDSHLSNWQVSEVCVGSGVSTQQSSSPAQCPDPGRDRFPVLNSMNLEAGLEAGHIISSPGPKLLGLKFCQPGAGPAQLYCTGLGNSRISRLFSMFELYQQEYAVSTN